jgi:hypothetical protein
LQAERCDGPSEIDIHHAGFDVRDPIRRIDAEYPRESIEAEDDGAFSERAPRQSGAGASWYERHIRVGERAHDVH